ncbi:MAG: DUF5686 family protein [Bacteroidales bacterium]|nr:DUF5686 family protein [Bacteroidales bacterium]
MQKKSNLRYFVIALIFIAISPIWAAKSAQTLTANEIIQKAIVHKESNRITENSFYSREHYEKLNLGWVNLTAKEKEMLLLKYFRFLFENTDSTDVSGKPVDFVLSKEILQDEFYKKSTSTNRTMIKAINKEWINSVLHEQGMQTVVNQVFDGYSLYDNQMSLLMQNIVSPLSSSFAQTIYNYTLEDTVRIEGILCYKINFMPVNEQFLAFRGSVYIADDSTYSVAKADYYIDHNANLNFIDTIGFKENYTKASNGKWVVLRNEVSLEMSLFKLFVRRINSFKNYSFEAMPDNLFSKDEPISYSVDAWNKSDIYWSEHRHFPFTNQEEKAHQKMAGFVNSNSGSVSGFFMKTIFNNLIPLKYITIGPLTSFVSSNEIEGTRYRFGGSTTADLNKHIFLEGYGAYGDLDKRLKYSGQLTYSLNKCKSHPNEYPSHSISLLYRYDMKIPGQELETIDKDNVLLSFRRAELDRMFLEKKAEIRYKQEYYNGLSFSFWGNHKNWLPVGAINFQEKTSMGIINPKYDMRTTEVGAKFRFAVGERFYQNRDSRVRVSRFSSVFTFSHTMGLKKFLNGDYNYHLTEMMMQHTHPLSIFGYADIMFKAGKQWSKVPYPLLIISQANPSYLNVPETYNLMNVFEFINDQYASLDIDYHMNGLLLNWIPVNRYLKWREVATFKSLVGTLSDYNDPAKTKSSQWLLPTNSSGLGSTPYMEAGVGIENIFSLLRLDYIWRLTYLDRPNVNKSGIRVGLKIQF